MKRIKGGITAPKGFLAYGFHCGIKKSGKPDLALLYSEKKACIAGAVTQNRFASPPVMWTKRIIQSGNARAAVINSGISNACTGKQGMKNATLMAQTAAKTLKTGKEDIVVASTGIIGEQLPMPTIKSGIKTAAAKLSPWGGASFARAIMTTDTVKKEIAVRFRMGKAWITVGGCAKGVGMIQPNMATLLAFLTTDADISRRLLNKIFKRALNKSFNRVTVDSL
jgi:glutamate N-acetyltransferase/amino-acid N-acetyltransferase